MKNIIINITLALASLLFTLFVLEIGARVYENEFGFKNFFAERHSLFQSAYPAKFDAELGWIPKKGNHPENVWKTKVVILEDGIRSNGSNEHLKPDNNGLILAVGDSFTFGDQVSNNETWPAVLEKMSGRRVINGGVFGYGIDQSYLRMRTLASKYKPDMVIFSFTESDVRRNQLSERTSVPKPFFELSETGDLVLMNDHIVYSPSSSFDIRKILGYSFFVHTTFSRNFPEYWFLGSWESKKAHSNGEEVTCRIFNELEQFSTNNKIDILILVQYLKDEFEKDKDIRVINNVISCVDLDTLRVVDMRYSLGELKSRDSKKYEGFFQGHMTKEGNLHVASILFDLISKQNEKP